MNNTQYTPGPWRNEGRKIIAGEGFSGVVADIHDEETAQGKANATLIASAPDLIAAAEYAEIVCQRIAKHSHGRYAADHCIYEAINLLKAAINKARS